MESTDQEDTEGGEGKWLDEGHANYFMVSLKF